MNRQTALDVIGRHANDTDLTALIFELMERKLTDADDFDPMDSVAENRSKAAKWNGEIAAKAYTELDIDTAIEHADKAMRLMDGDL